MGEPKSAAPVKLIAGILAASAELLEETSEVLEQQFGAIESRSSLEPWTHSTYYRNEMGDRVLRQYLSFQSLIGPGKLAGIKQRSNEIEGRWRNARGRQVNIDPGYLTALKLVLATTKDAAHRIYLSGGIYAEVTLEFEDSSFRPLRHTYPDYAAASALEFFNSVRAAYLAALRNLS